MRLPEQLLNWVKVVQVPQEKVLDGAPFPMTLTPSDPHAGPAERIDFLRAASKALLELVYNYGAVLLRGWGPCCAEHFSEISAHLNLEASNMACSAGPRFEVAANVFTANEAPPSERIPFHHEMAQCDAPPSVVIFFCDTPAADGGATPILQSRLAATYLRARYPTVAARLKETGVRYVRIMPPVTDPSSALGKSWRNSLRVETREEAEASLVELGSTWTWLPGDMLRTVSKAMPALIDDERSGHEVFFTAAETTFNRVADEAIGAPDAPTAPLTAPVRSEKAIIYGDGSPLDGATKEALRETGAFMLHAQVAIPWQEGDALLLNNATVQHSRESFTPPRRILASLVGSLSKVGALHEPRPAPRARPT